MKDFPVLSSLLSTNAQWAQEVNKADPDFFAKSATGQSPKVLWIGCADSRVPESVVTASKPGDIFVQRNIANRFPVDDVNALSVLSYAIHHLHVEHVIVVGHTKCGGAAACFEASKKLGPSPSGPIVSDPSSPPEAPINQWLAPLTTLAASLQVATMYPPDKALTVLVEENVKEQVKNLAKTEPVISAWAEGKVWVHGWVYEIEKGTLRDLGVSLGPPSKK